MKRLRLWLIKKLNATPNEVKTEIAKITSRIAIVDKNTFDKLTIEYDWSKPIPITKGELK